MLGAVLLASMIPVIAIRLRDYLQDSPALPGPGTLHLTLPAATYVVFEHTAKVGPYDCSPESMCVTIDPSDVSVVAQSGVPLPVYVDPSVDGITDRSDHYAGAIEFDIPQLGRYSITVRSSVTAGFVIAKQPSEEAMALEWLDRRRCCRPPPDRGCTYWEPYFTRSEAEACLSLGRP